MLQTCSSHLVRNPLLVPQISRTIPKRAFRANHPAHEENVSPKPLFNPACAFKLTQPPNPSWKLGQGLPRQGIAGNWMEEEKKGWMTWDLDETPSKQVHSMRYCMVLIFSRDTYRLLTSAIVPRPIAFISSLSSDGIPNLAPFRWDNLFP